jgi:hypothetical protein
MKRDSRTHIAVAEMPHDTGRPEGWHRHVCRNDSCRFEWSHDGAVQRSREEYDFAHRCPLCGAEQTLCAMSEARLRELQRHPMFSHLTLDEIRMLAEEAAAQA